MVLAAGGEAVKQLDLRDTRIGFLPVAAPQFHQRVRLFCASGD